MNKMNPTPTMDQDQVPLESNMDVCNDGPEEVTLDSDDDEDSEDEEDIIPIPTSSSSSGSKAPSRRTGEARSGKTSGGVANQNQPDVIDLTCEDDNEDDDEVMITDPPPANEQKDDVILDEDLPELIEVDPKEVAEDKKKRGNDLFKIGNYYQALGMYTQAIDAMPFEASYYGNRSACHMMLKRYKEALSDIRTSIQLDPTYEKGYLRLIRTTLALGNVKECELAFDEVGKRGMNVGAEPERERLRWMKTQLAEIEETKVKKEYRKLIYLASQLMDVATADNDLKMVKADALVHLGRHTEAQELCTEVLQNDMRCAEALYIRAICHYLDDNLEKSVQFIRQGLQYAPDNCSFQNLYKKIKQVKELREGGQAKFGLRRFEEAKSDYQQCLSLVSAGEMNNITIQSKLYFNLALIAHKKNQLDESLQACSKAIELNSKYLKAIIHRAKIFLAKEMYDDSVHDLEAALRIDPSLKHLKKELQDTKMAAKRAKRKDYYKILNVDKGATEDEIRKAYKKRALLHHPDRHANSTEAVQKEQERLFKDLGEAYEVLSDSKKRFRYDQGVDLMDDRGGYEPSYDQSDFINVFFGNGGIPSFRPGQGGPTRGGPQFHHGFRH